MKTFYVKVMMSYILDLLGVLDHKIKKLNKSYNNNYIRIINYHQTSMKNRNTFKKQLIWFKKYFQNVNYELLERFISGDYVFDKKPGIMITFDDGYYNNYEIAVPLLEKHQFTGYFFVSSDFVGCDNYMNADQLKKMILSNHMIGCHTATHHRMNINDTKEILSYEVSDSKKKLEDLLKHEVDMFCWCGGEEPTYTKEAAKEIKKSGYKYAFMTNSFPVTSETNVLQMERINCEADWGLPLIKFQICGFMDERLRSKRDRVELLTKV